MFKRGLSILVAGCLLLGNAPEAEIPSALAPFVADGKLKTDDFSWMRGGFDGATDQQKAEWESIQSWIRGCAKNGEEKAIAELKLLNINVTNLKGVPLGSQLCSSLVSFNGMNLPTKNWQEFVAREAKAREIFHAFQYGARIAVQYMPYEPAWGNEDAWDLLGATIEEQVYRSGFNWNVNEETPKLDPAIMPYFEAHLLHAGGKQDKENTKFLKELVAKKGWPAISVVGKKAAGRAWLLVQHADHDPAFQLTALRLMEPLVVKGEVSKPDYAYLYDRIMLKLNGKQRFGTQFGGCDGEEYKLRPLEDEKQLAKLRAEYELQLISEYRASMKKMAGPCQA
jgi:hypothetical protein